MGGEAGTPPLLEVRDLSVSFSRGGSHFNAVDGVSFSLRRGERVALVGESGSGKSVTALAVTRLIERLGGAIGPQSVVNLDGENLLQWPQRRVREVRGNRIAMIFQDPLSSLNPVYSIGDQIIEAIQLHRPIGNKDAREEAIALLDRVGIPGAQRRVDSFPHEFSGGMRQRAMIAMALASKPDLLIADEPTTALDVTIQGQILHLLDELVEDEGLSVLLITHDLGVVAGFTERLLVMYAGRLVETGSAEEMFHDAHHPYTGALIRSVPRLDQPRQVRLPSIPGAPPNPVDLPSGCSFHPRCSYADDGQCVTTSPPLLVVESGRRAACHYADRVDHDVRAVAEEPVGQQLEASPVGEPLLVVSDLVKHYQGRGGLFGLGSGEIVKAVDGVSFEVREGEAFGLVGESGSGKSTVARCVTRLVEPTSGAVQFDGHDLLSLSRRQLRQARRDVQMIFQDPGASLDSRWRVRAILAEPLRIHGLWGSEGHDEDRLRELMETVGLESDALQRFPHEFSGGQRQRIGIARALALRPKLIVCDEPVSALDVSIRAGIINLLSRLRRDMGLSYLFIAHDLSLVRHLCDRVAAMYKGKIVESGEGESFYREPKHPYTETLLACEPIPDPTLERARRASTRNVTSWTESAGAGASSW